MSHDGVQPLLRIAARGHTGTGRLLVGGLLALLAIVQFTMAANLRFEPVGRDSELQQLTTNNIFQDRLGFMWFCTQDGLYRFDGYTLTAFKAESQGRNGLAGNWTTGMAQDRHGRLWIASGNGLTCYDPIKTRFTIFRHDRTDPGSLSDDDISCLLTDRAGDVWIGTNNGGLNKLAADGRSFLHPGNTPQPPFSTAGKFIRSLYQDSRSAIWIGTSEAGLICFEPAHSGRVSHYRHDPGAADSLANGDIMAICEDRAGFVWIGTDNGGLDRFDAPHGAFIHNQPPPVRQPA